MSRLDSDLITEMQDALIETRNASSMTTDIWTLDELVDSLNDRQASFLRQTGCILTRESITGYIGVHRYEPASNSVGIRRLVWVRRSDGDRHPVHRATTWESDNRNPTWMRGRAVTRPRIFGETLTPADAFEVFEAPNEVGSFDALYVGISSALTGAGVALTVPDDFAHYIKWGVLADLLLKRGQPEDRARAAYCEARFEEGIELAKLFMTNEVRRG